MTTYYADYENGNDSNTGLSHAQRWKTQAKANAVLTTGDILLWYSGTTNTAERCNPAWGGTAGSHAVCGAYYLNGGVETRGWSGSKPAFSGGGNPFYGYWLANGTPTTGQKVVRDLDHNSSYLYTVVTGGTFAATFGTWVNDGTNFTNGTVTLRAIGTMDSNIIYTGLFEKPSAKNYFTFENLSGSNYWGRGLSCDDTTASQTAIYFNNIDIDTVAREAHVLLRSLTYCIVDGCTFNKCGLTAVAASFSGSTTAGSVAYANVGFSNSASAETNYHILRNNTYTKCAKEFILHHSFNSAYNNLHWNCMTGLYLVSGQNNDAYNNIIIGGPDTNFHFPVGGGYCGGAINISNEGSGVGLGGSRINNDYHDVWNNLIAFYYVALDMGDQNVITGGVTYYSGRNCNIVHNTFVDCKYAMRCWQSATYTDSRLQNNLFARYTANTMLYNFPGTIPTKGYNLWPTTPPAGLSSPNDVISTSPGLSKSSGWQSIASSTAVTAADFRPTSTSPAVGAGTYLTSFASDYYGNTRANPPDIGAIQTGSSVAASIYDTFTGAAGLITAHTPDTNTPGNAWVAASTSTSPPTAPGSLTGSGALQFLNDADGCVIDAEAVNGVLEVDWVTVAGLNNRASVLLRHASDGNCIQWNVRQPNGDMNVYVREAGAVTSTPINGQAYSWTAGNTYRLKAALTGIDIVLFVNGVQVASVQTATHSTATRFGLQRNTADTGQLFDNFSFSTTSYVSDGITAGALRLTGFAPEAQRTGKWLRSIPAASLRLTGFAPTDNNSSQIKIEIPAARLRLIPGSGSITFEPEDPFPYPLVPNSMADLNDWVKLISYTVNGIMQGRVNASGYIKLNANATTTTINVISGAFGQKTVIQFVPLTASAATALASMYVSARDVEAKTFTITHANTADIDKRFQYVFIG